MSTPKAAPKAKSPSAPAVTAAPRATTPKAAPKAKSPSAPAATAAPRATTPKAGPKAKPPSAPAVTASPRAKTPLASKSAPTKAVATSAVRAKSPGASPAKAAKPKRSTPGLSPEALLEPARFVALCEGRAGCSIPAPEQRGITIAQLKHALRSAAELCKAEGWTSASGSGAPLIERTITLYDLAKNLLVPATHARQCSFVELIAPATQSPLWFCSHWWGEPVVDFIDCLVQHSWDHGLDGETTPYWVCAYANCQHRLEEDMGSGSVEATSFYKALLGTVGTVAIVDQAGNYFTRLWCGYELHVSVMARGDEYRFDAYTIPSELAKANAKADAKADKRAAAGKPSEEETAALLYEPRAIGLVDGFAAQDAKRGEAEQALAKSEREAKFPLDLIWRALEFDVGKAQTSSPDDRERIMRAIDDQATLNATVAAKFGTAVMSRLLREAEGVKHGYVKLDKWLGTLSRSCLRRLSLDGQNALPREDLVRRLAEALPSHSIAELTVNGVGRKTAAFAIRALTGGATGAGAEAASLLPAGALKLLDLSRNSLAPSESEFAQLGEALRGAPILSTILLSSNELLTAGCEPLLRALAACTQLRVLDLANNGNGAKPPKASSAGAPVVAAKPTGRIGAVFASASLERLKLAGCVLGGEMEAVAPALGSNRTLVSLDLDGCGLLPQDLAHISTALLAGSALRELSLRNNEVGAHGWRGEESSPGIRGLARALSSPACPLRSLDLGSVGLEDREATELAKALGASTCALTSLDLESNELSFAAWTSFVKALATNTSLRTLRMRQSLKPLFKLREDAQIGSLLPRTDERMRTLLTATTSEAKKAAYVEIKLALLPDMVTRPLAANRSLTELDISDIQFFHPVDWQAILAGLQDNSTLRRLVLSRHDSLQCALPELRALSAMLGAHPTIRVLSMNPYPPNLFSEDALSKEEKKESEKLAASLHFGEQLRYASWRAVFGEGDGPPLVGDLPAPLSWEAQRFRFAELVAQYVPRQHHP